MIIVDNNFRWCSMRVSFAKAWLAGGHGAADPYLMNTSDVYLQFTAFKNGQHGTLRVFVKVPRAAITKYRRERDYEISDKDIAETLSGPVALSNVLKSYWLGHVKELFALPAEIQERKSFKCGELTFWVTSN